MPGKLLLSVVLPLANLPLARAAESTTDPLGFREPVVVAHGAESSLVRRVRSAVIIPGSAHAELWVHPELFSSAGTPVVIEFRARITDRRGKDAHGKWQYFRTDDAFETLVPLAEPTARLWSRKDLTVQRLSPPIDPTVTLPAKLGHSWCSAFAYLDASTVIQAFTTQVGARNSVQTLVARLENEKLVPLYISDAHSHTMGRGLYEPHVVMWSGRCFMTVRAEDGRGYVMVSEDRGRSWSKPKPWTWDSGETIAMNQTMTKFAAHSDGLVLVYTRIRADNANAFRNRSPLHIADIDVATLSLKQSTERVIVPNRSTGEKGLPVGNFWVWPIDDRETYVTVAEWPRDGRPQNGDIWLSKIEWKRPNQLLTAEGKERISEGRIAL